MPTRYNLADVDLKKHVTAEVLDNPEQKKAANKVCNSMYCLTTSFPKRCHLMLMYRVSQPCRNDATSRFHANAWRSCTSQAPTRNASSAQYRNIASALLLRRSDLVWKRTSSNLWMNLSTILSDALFRRLSQYSRTNSRLARTAGSSPSCGSSLEFVHAVRSLVTRRDFLLLGPLGTLVTANMSTATVAPCGASNSFLKPCQFSK
jgi:hypothetical protein